MKHFRFAILGLFLLTFMAGCKKDKETTPAPVSPVKQNDQAGSAEADAAMDDVNNFISNKIGNGANARLAAYNLPCGVVSVDSSTNNSNGKKIYKVNYGSQTPCGYKYKSGQISFTLQNGSSFSEAGAQHLITFNNYTVEVKATGSIVKLNGTITVTNVSGGYIWQAVTSSSTITHKIRGALDITYANNEVRPRNYFQQRTWSSNNGWAGLTLTIAGDSTNSSGISLSETGKTYEGNYDFQTQILSNLVWSNCDTTYAGPYKLKNGHAQMHVTVPAISNAYIDVEAGYYWDYTKLQSTPVLMNDCSSNAYKITTVIGNASNTVYQLY